MAGVIISDAFLSGFLVAVVAFSVGILVISLQGEHHSPKALRSEDRDDRPEE